jgi:hypothetical protein
MKGSGLLRTLPQIDGQRVWDTKSGDLLAKHTALGTDVHLSYYCDLHIGSLLHLGFSV